MTDPTDPNAAELGMEAAVTAMNLDDDEEEAVPRSLQTMPVDVLPSLQTMPVDVLRHTLVFVGYVPDLLSCERTCVALHRALSNADGGGDAVWRSLLLHKSRDEVVLRFNFFGPSAKHMTLGEFLDRADADPRLRTNREVACVGLVIQRIQNVQINSTSNVFVEKLGVDGWMHLVTRAFIELAFRTSLEFPPPLPEEPFQHAVIIFDEIGDNRRLRCRLRLRGDSSVVLSELLQQEMIDLFQRANFLLAEEMEDDDGAYPCLLARHLRAAYLLARAGSEHLCLGRPRDLPPSGAFTYAQCSRRLFLDEYVMWAEKLEATEVRDRVIRGLSLRAGVVKLHKDAFVMAWSILIHRTVALVEVPCRELFSLGRGVVNTKRPLESDQSMWDTPPYPRTAEGTSAVDPGDVTIYTPAPRQLEETARSLGIRAHRVFIHDWHVPAGSSLRTELVAAPHEYLEKEHSDVFMMDAGLHEVDGDYVEIENGSDDLYLSSDYSSCSYPSSDFDSDEDVDEDFDSDEDVDEDFDSDEDLDEDSHTSAD